MKQPVMQDMSAVMYLRYSSDNQTEQSIEGQRHVCEEFAGRSGYDVVGEYADRARSAKCDTVDNRPGFMKMIEDAKSGKFKFIIVYKLDRFARNRYVSAKYKHTLKKYGVRVVSATEYLTDSPESIMTEALLEANAEYFSAELSQKTKRGMRESALKCQSTGGSFPLGYKVGPYKKLEIDVNTADIPKIIFEKYADGEGKKQIADYLNSHGYRTKSGKSFQISSFENLLKNKKYIGIYTYDDGTGEPIEIENGCPALIDKELFERVQKKIEATKKAPAAAKAKVDYLLSGKLFCGYCGAPMTGECGYNRNGKNYNYYSCHNKKKYHSCKKKNERKDFIEWYICEQILSMIGDIDRKDEIADEIIEAYKKAFGATGVDDIEKRLKTVQSKIDNVTEIIAETGSRALLSKLENLELQKDEIEAELEQARITARHIPTHEYMVDWLTRFQTLDICEESLQYHIINIFVNRIYLWDDKMTVIFNLKNTSETVTFEEIRDFEKSYDDFDECSDLNGGGEPNQF